MTEVVPAAPPFSVGRMFALIFGVPVGLRLALLALEAARGQAVLGYVEFSDASSFLGVARAILDPSQVAALNYYDTRVFPLWPAVESVLLAIHAPAIALLLLPVLLSGWVCWWFYRVTGHWQAALLFSSAPPVWLLATVHPMSEAFYLLLGVGAALAVGARRWLLAGLLAGLMVATRPFGIAWVAAGVWLLLEEQDATWRTRAAYLAGTAVGGAVLVALNLHLHGDVLHQIRVYNSDLAALNLSESTAEHLGAATGHWGPPFWHVLSTPWRVAVPLWKTIYVYAHLGALLVLAAVAIRRLRRTDAADAPAGRFLLLAFLFNGALIVCTGPYWGFHSFDRYFLWGIPGALLALTSLVRASAWWGVMLGGGALSVAAAVFALHRLHP